MKNYLWRYKNSGGTHTVIRVFDDKQEAMTALAFVREAESEIRMPCVQIRYPNLSDKKLSITACHRDEIDFCDHADLDNLISITADGIEIIKDREGLLKSTFEEPVKMILSCPMCSGRHIDTGHFSTHPHHTHACQHCGHVWRPAIVPTVGVQFLPGFKNT